MFQSKKCPEGFKFCSTWPQQSQYKACIPEANTCHYNRKLYELHYGQNVETCKPGGSGNVCPYSNRDWVELLNGFDIVRKAPSKLESVASQIDSDERLKKESVLFKKKLACIPLELKCEKKTGQSSLDLTYGWNKFIAKGGGGQIHLFSEEKGGAPDVIVKLLVGKTEVCASSQRAVTPPDDAKTGDTENVWGSHLIKSACPNIVLQRCITPKAGYKCKNLVCKLVVMEHLSSDVDQLLSNRAIQVQMDSSVRDNIIWQTFQALKCIW